MLALALSLVLFGTCVLAGCGNGGADVPSDTTQDENTDEAVDSMAAHKEKAKALDGKRILFVGNSYMYYGQMLRTNDMLRQTVAGRSHDDGMFYELLKELGAEANVVNWTFGSHQLEDFFTDTCAAGKKCDGENHLEVIQNEAFDYVVLQICGREMREGYMDTLASAVAMFRATNPSVQFVYLYNPAAYGINGFEQGTYMTQAFANRKTIEEMGIRVADWGGIVMDMMYGKQRVKDGKFSYNQESFIIAQNEKDGYHPNQLAGYITTVMTYMALTGDTAEGLPFDFVGNAQANRLNDWKNFKDTYYKLRTTNYHEIIQDADEMNGILALIDEWSKNGGITK